MRREKSVTSDDDKLNADLSFVCFDTGDKNLGFFDREGFSHASDPINIEIAENAIIRSCMNAQTNDLEWYTDGTLVASTSNVLALGEMETTRNICRIGWTISDAWEMILYV